MSSNTIPPLPTLPLQLMLTMGCWLSSPFALRCAKSAFPFWSSAAESLDPNPAPNPDPLANQNLASVPDPLEQAIRDEAENRANSLLSGVLRYVDSSYTRRVSEPPVIWQKGNARLLDYGVYAPAAHTDQPIVLFVPSLINRYYIFDLEEERSFIRFLAQQGIYSLVLDWGTPGETEAAFNCNDYVTEILIPAITYITNVAKQRVILAGYCMGGVLSLAAAKLQRQKIAALALFATPWDFSCEAFFPFIVDQQWHPWIERLILEQKQLPADVIQSLFTLTAPWVFEQKFRRFATIPEDSNAARQFVVLERWVNDGVPMTAPVARDCMIGWAQQNILSKCQWKVGKTRIDPKTLRMPAFVVVPKNDHVVPQECAIPLAEAIPGAQLVRPKSGHVSMMVGSSAKRELWLPFLEWVSSIN